MAVWCSTGHEDDFDDHSDTLIIMKTIWIIRYGLNNHQDLNWSEYLEILEQLIGQRCQHKYLRKTAVHHSNSLYWSCSRGSRWNKTPSYGWQMKGMLYNLCCFSLPKCHPSVCDDCGDLSNSYANARWHCELVCKYRETYMVMQEHVLYKMYGDMQFDVVWDQQFICKCFLTPVYYDKSEFSC